MLDQAGNHGPAPERRDQASRDRADKIKSLIGYTFLAFLVAAGFVYSAKAAAPQTTAHVLSAPAFSSAFLGRWRDIDPA